MKNAQIRRKQNLDMVWPPGVISIMPYSRTVVPRRQGKRLHRPL
jgi:hypothetical protein